MKAYELGDQLRIKFAWGVYHVGIYVGDPYGDGGDYVAHAAKGGTVALITLDEFAGGQVPEVASRVPWDQQEAAVERALSKLGQPYDALFANCEHLTSFAQTGQAWSPTVFAITLAVSVVGLVWASRRSW